MTTRKYNTVRKLCSISRLDRTFSDVLKAAESHFGDMLESMTAAQIAGIIEFGYCQHVHGAMSVPLED